jgi:triosephosphate isomerase
MTRSLRQKFIAGNWKMYTTLATARELAAAVAKGLSGNTAVQTAVCPPFPYLVPVADVLRDSPVALGAQDVYFEKEGAFTGEVSTAMLLDCGCRYVIVGHSERRHLIGESDAVVNRKVQAALSAGLHVILCLGETLAQRQANQTESVLDGQLTQGLKGVGRDRAPWLVLAYEPVWAIGTGHNATPEQAEAAHRFLRRRVGELLGEEAAAALLIQYGGSVKPDNAASLLSQPNVDGALVGGASLKADQFLAIVRAAGG